MKILVTGSNGFIAKNLISLFSSESNLEILEFSRKSTLNELESMLMEADWIIHLAGINRPENDDEFTNGNVKLTKFITDFLKLNKKKTPIILSSSIQVENNDSTYSKTKSEAESLISELSRNNGNKYYICRLANVFGKWSRPNYNSAVATFCYNIIHDLPITIHQNDALIRLVYIDDVVNTFLQIIKKEINPEPVFYIQPEYKITVGELAHVLRAFKESRTTLTTDNVGTGLKRALYATYLSFIEPKQFDYFVPKYEDNRGVFVEMLKTPAAGQFSYFTAHPGITRGGHYHHTKNEKFLVIKGHALFKFKHIITDETYELEVNGSTPQIVETVPGWSHDITNVGDDEMIVMLWANEIFDRSKPDTYAMPLTNIK